VNAAAPAAPAAAAAGPAAAVSESDVRIVSNQTHKRLIVTARDGGSLVFAPLERRALSLAQLARFDLSELVNRNWAAIDEPVAERERTRLAVLGVYSVAAYVIVGWLVDWGYSYWIAGAAVLLLAGLVGWRASESGALGRWLAQLGSLVFVVVVGLALPGTALYFGANLPDAISTAVNGTGAEQEAAIVTVLGRVLQVVFIATVTLLPGLLYFLFDRARLETLRDRFTRQIFRLDRTLQTRADINAKYGALVEEAYGAPAGSGVRLQPGTQWPLIVATVVIGFGWLLTLLNPQVEIITTEDLSLLFAPWQTAVAFGFLGAYFFSLTAVLRGYVRGDLRPKTYSYIAVRIILVILLSWLLEIVIPYHELLLVTAFLTGIVPDTALYRLREVSRSAASSRRQLNAMFEPLPLTGLDGIDLYDRARLETEGVTNIESLAHHDLVDLMLQTRIPVPRLVDWTDQAILYLHLGIAADGTDTKGRNALDLLRRHGVRTATDLERVHAMAVERGVRAERELLDLLPPDGDGAPPRLRVILDAIGDDEWMDALRYWHDPAHQQEQALRFP
jgi:hypothetical protein